MFFKLKKICNIYTVIIEKVNALQIGRRPFSKVKDKSMRGLLFVIVIFIANVGLAQEKFNKEIIAVLKDQALEKATWALKEQPVTITAFVSPRSAGGKHDFYSEGDYWWPDPNNPNGPYIQRDGQTNPDNFVAHRHAMIRLSQIIGALASAYVLSGDDQYVSACFLSRKSLVR